MDNDLCVMAAMDDGFRTFILAESVGVIIEAQIECVVLSDDYHGDGIVSIIFVFASNGGIDGKDELCYPNNERNTVDVHGVERKLVMIIVYLL